MTKRKMLDPFDYGPPIDCKVMSREESMKFEQERLEKKITPELLTHFSIDRARELVKYFDSCPSTQTFGPTYNFENLLIVRHQFRQT